MANTRGRQPIGVDQPPGGGTNYPFVQPSSDIQNLLGDLFVSFDDLDDTYVFPLKVSWMYGFGTDAVAPPPGYPTPTHTHDIIITDANDVVVFDSTLATKFTSDPWDSRLLILEWTNSGSILRCVQHTEWTQADIDDGLDRTYDEYIEPTNGVLQVDTWYKLPKRIRSIQVGIKSIEGTKLVTLAEGYNVTLEQEEPILGDALNIAAIGSKPLNPGTRKTTGLRLNADPGTGLGIFPGCSEVVPEVKRINGVEGNIYQNFTYDTEGCIRSQRPVSLVSDSPREFTYAASLLPTSEAAATISTANDCQNCCQCTYFAQTYQGLKRQWFLYKDVATAAEEVRDLYQSNIDRWEVQKAIREADSLRARVNMDGKCKVSWGFAHCNSSKCCLYNVKADVTFLYYLNGVLTTPTQAGYDCGGAEIDSAAGDCEGPATVILDTDSTGQHTVAFWDYADPQYVTSLRAKFCFPDCSTVATDALKIRMHCVVSWELSGNDPGTGDPCSYPLLTSSDYDADVLSTWTSLGVSVPAYGRRQVLTDLIAVSPVDPFCQRCECEAEAIP